MNKTIYSIAQSWCETEKCLHREEEILEWIRHRNENLAVEIKKTPMEENDFWFYDKESGCIRNRSNSFFSICGLRKFENNTPILSQPVLIQEEIGYLGIICREFNGIMHFLMQAKIEPGNVNKIQISPTLQATKSNFTQKHGGGRPPYLDYFINAERYEIVVDQIQSEQSSRFNKKRNRNIIIRVEGEEIPVLPSHCWMTLGQIKNLMRKDNLVNMDARTVLSCIPYCSLHASEEDLYALESAFENKALFRSVFFGTDENLLPVLYRYINNFKMFSEEAIQLVPLHELTDWEWINGEFCCRKPYPFKLVYCDISIEGREVRRWKQPLFEAIGCATFGLITCEENGITRFLVRATPELGCFDKIELGPTVQQEAAAFAPVNDSITRFFWEKEKAREGIIFDQLLSEEGGRFYHEQNRNVLLQVSRDELPPLPEGYFLADFKTLNSLQQVNNTLNIQLRNLLSVIEV